MARATSSWGRGSMKWRLRAVSPRVREYLRHQNHVYDLAIYRERQHDPFGVALGHAMVRRQEDILGVKRPPLAHNRVIEVEDVGAVAVLEQHFMDQPPGGVDTHGRGDLGPDQAIAVEGRSHH